MHERPAAFSAVPLMTRRLIAALVCVWRVAGWHAARPFARVARACARGAVVPLGIFGCEGTALLRTHGQDGPSNLPAPDDLQTSGDRVVLRDGSDHGRCGLCRCAP